MVGCILPPPKLSSQESKKSHEPLNQSPLQPLTEEILVNLALSHKAMHADMFFETLHTICTQACSQMCICVHVLRCFHLVHNTKGGICFHCSPLLRAAFAMAYTKLHAQANNNIR